MQAGVGANEMKIVTKIVLLVIVSVSVIMGGVSLLISNRMQRTVLTQIDHVLATNLEFAAKDMAKTTDYIRRTAEIISHNRAIRKSLSLSVSRGINQILNELVTIYPFFNFVVIAEPNGDIFAASTRDRDGRKVGGEQLLGLNIKQSPMIEQKLEDFTGASKEVASGRPGSDPYLQVMGMKGGDSQWIVAPVHGRGGLIGWVVLSYDWEDEISALLGKITKHLIDIGNPIIETILVNADGHVVAGDRAGHLKFEPDPSTLWKSRRVMIGATPMDLIIVNDLIKTNEPMVKTRELLLGIVLLSSIALIFVLYFLLRQILLRRLGMLHAGTLQLGAGNLTTRLPELGKDEIGNLASAFNHMADWLQSTTVSRDYMDNVLESITDGIVTIDEQGLITTCNHATLEMFGYERDEVIGRNVSILSPPAARRDHQTFTANSQIHAPRIISLNRDLEGCRKDGSLFPMELMVTPMQVGGKRGFVGTIRDITERKEVDRMKSEFISTVSHELRTPLTSIRGSLGMVESGVLKDPEKVSQMIHLAASNTERLIDLVNDLLDMEKLQSGSLEFQFEDIDIHSVVENALEANQPYAKKHDVEFKFTSTLNEATVSGDRGRLTQVLANLLSNAAKFSPAGGAVLVSIVRRQRMIRVSVSDKGPGIPEEFRGKIFERFTQADSSDTRQKGGTGLGLSISKAIVEKHGGEIGFDTESGKGTTFFFELAEKERSATAAEMPATPEATTGGRGDRTCARVLVLEDDPDVARLLKMMLEQDGNKVEVAANADEARRLIAKQRFDLMTVDIMLPDQDGISLIRDIRTQEKTKDLPSVIISAKADVERHEVETSRMGIIEWLDKPIDQERLLKAVHRVIGTQNVPDLPRVLHIEDDRDLMQVMATLIGDSMEYVRAATVKEGRRLLRSEKFDLLIVEPGMPDGGGFDLLSELAGSPSQDAPTIIYSSHTVPADAASRADRVLLKSRCTSDELLAVIHRMTGGEQAHKRQIETK